MAGSSTGRRPTAGSSSSAAGSASRSTRRPRSDRCPSGWQQRVEILKALYRDARVLVLDEPTAVLTPQETEEIFEVLRRLASEGHSIVFISHKLYEVLDIADRITVIRRGKVVGQRIPSETNEEDLAELMVGREVSLIVDRGESHAGEVALKVEKLVVRDDRGQEAVHEIDLEVRAGEILGIAGVAGNGQDELVEAIVGLRKPTSGKVTLAGQDITGLKSRVRLRGAASATCRPTGTASGWCCRSASPTTSSSPATTARPTRVACCATTTRSGRRPRSGSRRSTSGRPRPMRRPRRCPAGTSRRSSSRASSRGT